MKLRKEEEKEGGREVLEKGRGMRGKMRVGVMVEEGKGGKEGSCGYS